MIFLFTEIDHPEVLEKRGSSEADHVLASQFFLIEEILFKHGVHWMKRTPSGVLAVFGGGDGSEGAPPPPGTTPAAPQAIPSGMAQGRPGEAILVLQKEFQGRVWDSFGKARLKAALHAGEAEPAGQNYVGPEVHHALKVLVSARSGQTLLTVPAVHFIPLPPGSRLNDMGKHFLKDLTEPQTLYALLHTDLAEDGTRPPLSLADYPQNFSPRPRPSSDGRKK